MICSLEKKEIEEIRPTNILPQTTFWGQLKSKQGFIPCAFELTVSNNLLYTSSNSSVKINDDILPKNTFFLDLTLNENDLLYNMII